MCLCSRISLTKGQFSRANANLQIHWIFIIVINIIYLRFSSSIFLIKHYVKLYKRFFVDVFRCTRYFTVIAQYFKSVFSGDFCRSIKIENCYIKILKIFHVVNNRNLITGITFIHVSIQGSIHRLLIFTA